MSLLYSFKIQITISYAKHSFNWRNPQSLNSVCTSLLSNFYLWTNIINSKTLPNSIFTSIRFFIQHVCTSPAFKYQRKEERDSRVKDLDRLSIFFVIITKSLTSSLTNTITELFYTPYTKTSSWKHWALHATKQLITHFQQLRLLQNLWSFITVACLDFFFNYYSNEKHCLLKKLQATSPTEALLFILLFQNPSLSELPLWAKWCVHSTQHLLTAGVHTENSLQKTRRESLAPASLQWN